MKKPENIYRNVYLGRDDAARELAEDLSDLSRSVDISIAWQTRAFFRTLVANYRAEIDVYRERRNHVPD